MKVIKVTNKTFNEEVINSKTKVLVDFNADWCGPCRMLAPILDELAKENKDLKIVSVNIDENENLAREYNVFSIPCIVVINEGKEEKRHVGLLSRTDLEKFIGE